MFPYGSEKEKWINDVTPAFNRSGVKTSSGKTIFVRALPMGSGETIDNILSGRLQAHLASPASAAFIKLGNAESRAKSGKDLIAAPDNLVLSPVVIAMWKPMAEAIGWGKKPLGWADILALARNEKGWQAYGYPQWGNFKFGHTHPEFKIPLFPPPTPREGFDLLRMLCAKRGLTVPESSFASLESCIPTLLTPGSAEALAVKIYRQVRTGSLPLDQVLTDCLAEYQNPISPEVMAFQIQIAASEATALEFVPQIFRRKSPG